MKVETTLGALITTVAVAYLIGQGVGCLKTIMIQSSLFKEEKTLG